MVSGLLKMEVKWFTVKKDIRNSDRWCSLLINKEKKFFFSYLEARILQLDSPTKKNKTKQDGV